MYKRQGFGDRGGFGGGGFGGDRRGVVKAEREAGARAGGGQRAEEPCLLYTSDAADDQINV